MCPETQRCRYYPMQLCPCAVGTSVPRRIGGVQKGYTVDPATCQTRRIAYLLKVAEQLSPER
jgi:hypothetical protein